MSSKLFRVPRAEVPPEAWDAFVDWHLGGWHFHRSGWLDYGLADDRAREDLSFAVIDPEPRGFRDWDERFTFVRSERNIVGLCPLIREGDRCAFQGAPGALPLASSRDALEEIGRGLSAAKLPLAFRSCPLVDLDVAFPPAAPGRSVVARRDHLGLHRGAVPGRNAWRSRVLDLTRSEAELHAGLRGSYKALVNRTSRAWRIASPGDPCSPQPLDFERVHRAANPGGKPRPPEFYAYYAHLVKEGRAFLVGARRMNGGSAEALPGAADGSSPSASTVSWGAVAFVFVGKGGAYYGSGPSLVPGTMHAVLWRAILAAKIMGLTLFEIGWQGHADVDDDKGCGVEHFKAGFGGADVPVWTLEVA